MIWFALRVAPNKEFVVERILRDDGLTVAVPLKHIFTKRPRRHKVRALVPRPQLPGYVFLATEGDPALDLAQASRFRFVQAVVQLGNEKILRDDTPERKAIEAKLPDIMRLLEIHQRPQRPAHNFDRRMRRGLQVAEITAGPYVRLDDDNNVVPRIVRTAGGDNRAPEIIIDNPPLAETHNRLYKPRPDALSTEAGKCQSPDSPAGIKHGDRAHCVPSSRHRKRA